MLVPSSDQRFDHFSILSGLGLAPRQINVKRGDCGVIVYMYSNAIPYTDIFDGEGWGIKCLGILWNILSAGSTFFTTFHEPHFTN